MDWIVAARLLAYAGLFTGALLMGWSVAEQLERRPRQLREMRTALQMLETEIAYAATPLPEVFRLLEKRFHGETALFFQHLSKEMHFSATAGDAWQQTVDGLYPQMAWNREDRAILVAMAPTLGLSDRQDQMKHLRLCQERLAMAERTAAGRAEKEGRLYRSLGMLAGLLFVLLAW